MAARAFSCPKCTVTLGTLTRKHDHRGRPFDRLRLKPGITIGHSLFRGQHAKCKCGARVPLPEMVTTVEFQRGME